MEIIGSAAIQTSELFVAPPSTLKPMCAFDSFYKMPLFEQFLITCVCAYVRRKRVFVCGHFKLNLYPSNTLISRISSLIGGGAGSKDKIH
jgi:hypothetical protein